MPFDGGCLMPHRGKVNSFVLMHWKLYTCRLISRDWNFRTEISQWKNETCSSGSLETGNSCHDDGERYYQKQEIKLSFSFQVFRRKWRHYQWPINCQFDNKTRKINRHLRQRNQLSVSVVMVSNIVEWISDNVSFDSVKICGQLNWISSKGCRKSNITKL